MISTPSPKWSSNTNVRPSSSVYLPMVARIAVALLGGYAFTWGLTTFGIAGLVMLGVDFHEAEMLLMLVAFLVFLPLFLWAFASRYLARVAAMLFGGALLMTAAAWCIQRALLL